jgi:hypothetical protein
MAAELPYLSTYKNVGELFQRIISAKQPDAFTTRYLTDTIGLKGTGDRQLIALLKVLGFLDSAGRPTSDYGNLKNPAKAPQAIAEAIRHAYEPLYAANEKAHDLGATELRGLVAQVAGSNTEMTKKIVGTYSSLVKLADFSKSKEPEVPKKESEKFPEFATPERPGNFGSLRPEFHYNIQVHLPTNASEETYLNIFNALRKAFKP